VSDLSDTVNEALERGAESRLHSIVALSVAIAATFMAICNVKDGNIVQAMSQDQANAVDQWSYYQAKGMKENLAEAMLDQLTLQRDLVTDPRQIARIDQKIVSYRAQIKKYADEKAAIRKQAEDFQKQYDALNVHDDQFDMSEACLSVALALFGVTALTKKRWLFAFASVFMFFGFLFGLAGFCGWSLHPDFLARLLS
jgi:DNA repair ATPase RecN